MYEINIKKKFGLNQVQQGSEILNLVRTQNWTCGPVLHNHQTLDRTSVWFWKVQVWTLVQNRTAASLPVATWNLIMLNNEQDVVSGNFRQVIVSPEISTSSVFCTAVLSKMEFNSQLHAVCIDEAHCISLWGGGFHPDYGDLGVFCGWLPSNVPFVIASATLPDHILDDIWVKLQLLKDVTLVSLSNGWPNITLSYHSMQHPEESKADLCFLIPPHASNPEDIDITLVYCNQRIICEDASNSLRRWAKDEGLPEACIAFYHAKVGNKRKREMEEMLQRGEIRILFCTDAVCMVCEHCPITQFNLEALADYWH